MPTLPAALRRVFPLCLALFVLAGCGPKPAAPGSGASSAPSSAAAPLRVGVIPFEDPKKIQDNYKQFADYLGRKCGRPSGEVFVTLDYAGVLEALKADQIDCAYLNPLSYALAVQEFKSRPQQLVAIAMPYFHGKPSYQGVIYARADSGINAMKDFKGKSFAFSDPTSTSGYLYPADMMRKAGVNPKKDIKPLNNGGPGGVLAVFNKQVDGGATFEGGIELTLKDPAQAKQLKVIARTPPIPNGMFVARGNLDKDTLDKMTQAMTDINTEPDGQAALKAMQYDKWVPADDTLFDPVREKAKIFGLNLQSLDAPKKK